MGKENKFDINSPPEVSDFGGNKFKADIERANILLESSQLDQVSRYAQGIENAKFVLDGFGLSKLRGVKYIGGIELAKEIGEQKKKTQNFSLPADQGADRILYTSKLGTPVFIDITLESPPYTLDGANYPATSITMAAVLVQVSMQKLIVKTAVQGYNDIIKEYISNGSWNVNIKGVLLGTNRKYPKDDFNKILTIGLCPYPIKVTSWYLNQYGITDLVVETPEFPQEEGKYSMQLFEFACLSDKPIELKLA